MRIGLDLRPTETGFKAHAGRGTGRYTTELIRHLLGMQDSRTLPFDLVPLRSSQFSSSVWEDKVLETLPFGKMTFESQFLYPRRVKRAQVDMAHFFAHGDASARPLTPQVVTVLDVIPLRFPELYKADKPNWRFRFARFLEYQAIRKASGILAISEATKADVVEILGVDPNKIVVTPLAVSEQFKPCPSGTQGAVVGEELQQMAQIQQLPTDRPIVLYVGGIDPRKNVPFLVDAFAQLLAQWPTFQQGGAKPLLVLAGGISKDDQFPALCRKIEQLGLENDVHMCGYVPDEVLCQLYHSAALFAFPSLYEGFGLPVLEAMACGCPVVAGNNSSIPEVAGDAAELVPDKNISAWVEAMKEVLISEPKREQMSERGISQAQQFSWQRTAEQTALAYQQFSQQLFPNQLPKIEKQDVQQRRHAANS